VDAGRVRDVADDLVGFEIDDRDVAGVRDVQPVRGAVDGQVVPAALAADRDLADDVVAGRGDADGGAEDEATERGEERSSLDGRGGL
jgi:hypothetical protein